MAGVRKESVSVRNADIKSRMREGPHAWIKSALNAGLQ